MPLHHIVPKMILRRFAKDQRMLKVVDRENTSKKFLLSVDKAGSERGFYHIPKEAIKDEYQDSHDPEGLEEALSKIETLVSPVLSQLRDGGIPEKYDDKIILASFVALQHTRGWHFRKVALEVANHFAHGRFNPNDLGLQARAGEHLRSRGEGSEAEDVISFIESCRDQPWNIEIPKQNLIDHSIEAAGQMATTLMGRPLRVFRFKDTPLLTSDDAVGLWDPTSNHPRSVSWFRARGVFMAIDRYTALGYMSRGNDQNGFANPSWASYINSSIADRATKHIYHHPDDNPLLNIHLMPPAKLTTVRDVLILNEDGRLALSNRYVWV